jgi:acylphosphatase
LNKAVVKTVRLRITGGVQAVGYRAWAIEAATGLGLSGWVRNRFDGTVEVLASGDEEAITAMIEACRRGPPAARVTNVAVAEAEDDGSLGFTPRPTV